MKLKYPLMDTVKLGKTRNNKKEIKFAYVLHEER